MNKYKKLILGIVLDAIGLVSFIIPGVGEFSDIVWAPISAWIMTRMYQGKAGKIAGFVALIEEALPGIDVIPSFTLMWFYSYVIKKQTPEIKA
ncbi:MAG: hypothetical protein ABJQ39_03365 [Winogradskyella arenosi]